MIEAGKDGKLLWATTSSAAILFNSLGDSKIFTFGSVSVNNKTLRMASSTLIGLSIYKIFYS
jgi:hypothetical protein